MQQRQILVRHNDFTVGAWIEQNVSEECPAYYPLTVLFYLRKGSLHFREGEKQTVFHAPAFVLFRKNTLGFYRKSWSEQEGAAQTYLIAFNHRFLISQDLNPLNSINTVSNTNPIVLPTSSALLAVFKNLENKINSRQQSLTKAQASDLSIAALKSVLAVKPELHHFFSSEINTPSRGLSEIIDHIYQSGTTIETLAYQSGRSLSGFYREFKREFNATPHQWIMERRLLEAYELLKTKSMSVTRVALDLGFKDLPHFSRRFKKRFGIPPSSLAKSRPPDKH